MKKTAASTLIILMLVSLLSLDSRSQDIISEGSNKWILHTPDDGRTELYIAPWTNGWWDWTKETIFSNNGDIYMSGGLQLKFDNLLGCQLYDKFTYNGKDMPHYGLKWYVDSALPGSPIFALSGYNGIKLFTGGKMNFYINSNGNIGIGTENPTNKFDVNGTIRAKEVKVTLDGWSDFVFKAEYQLRPLSEVELFIKENGHLPEIPTEKEVTQNGVSLGEMNAKLLQKVEELTLYLIEQKKEIEMLKLKLTEKDKQKRITKN